MKSGKMNYKIPELIFKVCRFADNNVDLELLRKYFLEPFDIITDTSLTIGVNFNSKDVEVRGKLIRLTVWDWRLEDQYKKITPYYIEGTNGLLLMYNITNPETLNYLTNWLKLTKERKKEGIPILLVGNKSEIKENREVSEEQVEKFKEDYKISSSMEISLKTGKNVEEMFMKITGMMYRRYVHGNI